MWNILGNYSQIPLVMVGDKAQLPPVVLSHNKTKGFSSPLRMSLFQRLNLMGQPSVLLNEQYRMVDVMGSMVLTLFYSSQLTNAPGTNVRDRPRSQQIVKYLHTVYNVNSPFLLLQVHGTTLQDANKSKYNVESASAALTLGLDMIDKKVIQPQDLLIMTSYRAQFRLYRQPIRTLALQEPTWPCTPPSLIRFKFSFLHHRCKYGWDHTARPAISSPS